MGFHCFVFIILVYSSMNSAESINYTPDNFLIKLLLSTQERLSNPNPSSRYDVLRNLGERYHKRPLDFVDDVSIEAAKPEIMEEIQELDQVEEQSNFDLVEGINLMAERNETLDQVVDNVVQTNTIS